MLSCQVKILEIAPSPARQGGTRERRKWMLRMPEPRWSPGWTASRNGWWSTSMTRVDDRRRSAGSAPTPAGAAGREAGPVQRANGSSSGRTSHRTARSPPVAHVRRTAAGVPLDHHGDAARIGWNVYIVD